MAGEEVLPILDDEGPPRQPLSSENPWRVLIVDDQEAIIDVTQLMLEDLVVDGRPLQILSALSCKQAIAVLAEQPPQSIDLAIIDVIMETADAGYRLVEHIRRTLGDQRMRIILRTGDPGTTPTARMAILGIDGVFLKTDLRVVRLHELVTDLLRRKRS